MADSVVSRRLSEILGVALFAIALLWMVALVSYSPSDPVWFFNNASRADVANFAGRVGAFLAVVSFQLLGYAAFFLPVVLGFAGWHAFWCIDVDARGTKFTGARPARDLRGRAGRARREHVRHEPAAVPARRRARRMDGGRAVGLPESHGRRDSAASRCSRSR